MERDRENARLAVRRGRLAGRASSAEARRTSRSGAALPSVGPCGRRRVAELRGLPGSFRRLVARRARGTTPGLRVHRPAWGSRPATRRARRGRLGRPVGVARAACDAARLRGTARALLATSVGRPVGGRCRAGSLALPWAWWGPAHAYRTGAFGRRSSEKHVQVMGGQRRSSRSRLGGGSPLTVTPKEGGVTTIFSSMRRIGVAGAAGSCCWPAQHGRGGQCDRSEPAAADGSSPPPRCPISRSCSRPPASPGTHCWQR